MLTQTHTKKQKKGNLGGGGKWDPLGDPYTKRRPLGDPFTKRVSLGDSGPPKGDPIPFPA